ncbi:hypothetical protein HHI36_010804 [Cryptolaemus montrouzieri]|uniref:C2 domain-containing protein n=1 Tax=Cryptolaemus montrouzieri TaxID=559131 RepID=A0ABD2MJS0_9CUCU
MVIEFWEKFETKIILFGLTKLPLHQFYVAYRNPDVTKYLANNQLPIISSDWWESISNPYTDELLGQVQILLALGTEKQIHNLELERGFKTHTVKANFETPLEIKQVENSKVDDKNIRKFAGKKKDESVIPPKVTDKISFKGGLRISKPLNVDKESITLPRSTEDKGVQSDFEMNSEDLSKDKDVTSTDKLGQLLNQILAMQTQRSDVVEMGTNTDNEGVEQNANNMKNKEKKTKLPSIPDDFSLPTSSARTESFNYENAPPLVRSTSDLLNTLQAALSIPPTKRPLISANRTSIQDNAQKVLSKHIRTSFKAQIFINQALHLPVRKKCKTRKSKGKSGKSDDNVKPSCYVTFETMPGLDLKMTPLVAKSTNPNWNYKCDVFLLLQNCFAIIKDVSYSKCGESVLTLRWYQTCRVI